MSFLTWLFNIKRRQATNHVHQHQNGSTHRFGNDNDCNRDIVKYRKDASRGNDCYSCGSVQPLSNDHCGGCGSILH